jgi:hypothetical protein
MYRAKDARNARGKPQNIRVSPKLGGGRSEIGGRRSGIRDQRAASRPAGSRRSIALRDVSYYDPEEVMTTITCKITDEMNARLEMIARRRRVSKSAVLREALESKVRHAGKSAAPKAFDIVKHLCGRLRGPSDLSTNPRTGKGSVGSG